MNVIIKTLLLFKRLNIKILSSFYSSQFKQCGKSVRFEKMDLLVGGTFISIGANTRFQRHLYLTAWNRYKDQYFSPNIIIGTDCDFGAYNHITCVNRIVIGNGVLTGKWVTISDNNHGGTSYENMLIRPQERKVVSKGEVCIGDRVFIGDKATILSGVKIGEGTIIGANSVVTTDLPSYCVVGGNPARIIKNIKN